MAGGTAAAFDDAFATVNGFLVEGPFGAPAAGQIIQRVASGRKGPLCGGGLFDDDRLLFFIFNVGGTREDAGLRIDGVAQRDINFARNILHQYVHGLRTVWSRADEVEDEVAIAVGERNFKGRLGVQPRAPSGVFLRRGGGRRIKRSHFRK